MKKILISLGLTTLVGALFGLLFKSFFVFGIAIVLQILFFYFFNTVFENFLVQNIVKANIEFEKEKLKNTVKVLCPCSENNQQDILVNLNEDTIYQCSKCKKDVRASTNVGTSLVTTPIVTKR